MKTLAQLGPHFSKSMGAWDPISQRASANPEKLTNFTMITLRKLLLQLLMRGQQYIVSLDMQMPESPPNQNLGRSRVKGHPGSSNCGMAMEETFEHVFRKSTFHFQCVSSLNPGKIL